MSKKEFIDKFLQDQAKKDPSKNKKSTIPFKEGVYLDIINMFREQWGDDVNIVKDKDVTIERNGEKFNIKIVAKRTRVAI